MWAKGWRKYVLQLYLPCLTLSLPLFWWGQKKLTVNYKSLAFLPCFTSWLAAPYLKHYSVNRKQCHVPTTDIQSHWPQWGQDFPPVFHLKGQYSLKPEHPQCFLFSPSITTSSASLYTVSTWGKRWDTHGQTPPQETKKKSLPEETSSLFSFHLCSLTNTVRAQWNKNQITNESSTVTSIPHMTLDVKYVIWLDTTTLPWEQYMFTCFLNSWLQLWHLLFCFLYYLVYPAIPSKITLHLICVFFP